MDSFPRWQREQYAQDCEQLSSMWNLQRGEVSRERLKAACEELGLSSQGRWTGPRERCAPGQLAAWLERRHAPGARGVTLKSDSEERDLAHQAPQGEVTELLLLWGDPLRCNRSVLADHDAGAARWQLGQDFKALRAAAEAHNRSGRPLNVTVLPVALRPGGLRLARQGYWLSLG